MTEGDRHRRTARHLRLRVPKPRCPPVHFERQVAAYKPLVQAVRNVLEEGQMYAEDLALLRLALEQVERANG